jgi:hypothetical protein
VPAIDLDLTVTIDIVNRRYRVTGAHDGFPAYELYVEINSDAAAPVYRFDPGPVARWPDLIIRLFPPEEIHVDTGWIPF